MSQDWRKRLEENVEAERKRKEKVVAAAEAEEYARKLTKLSRRFKCHVCGARPTVPLVVSPDPYSGWSWSGTDWDEPGDLHRCYCCNKWTCENHCHYIGNIGGYVCINHAGEQIRKYSDEADELKTMGAPLIISIIVLLVPSLLWSFPVLGLVFAFCVWYFWGYKAKLRTKLLEIIWGIILLILAFAIVYGVVIWLSSRH